MTACTMLHGISVKSDLFHERGALCRTVIILSLRRLARNLQKGRDSPRLASSKHTMVLLFLSVNWVLIFVSYVDFTAVFLPQFIIN